MKRVSVISWVERNLGLLKAELVGEWEVGTSDNTIVIDNAIRVVINDDNFFVGDVEFGRT